MNEIGAKNLDISGKLIKIFDVGFWLTLLCSLILPSLSYNNTNQTFLMESPVFHSETPKAEHVFIKPEKADFKKFRERLNYELPKINFYKIISNKKITVPSAIVVSLLMTVFILNITIWSTRSKVEKLIQAERYEDAQKELILAIQKDPHDETLFLLLGKSYLLGGQADQAHTNFSHALNINNDIKEKIGVIYLEQIEKFISSNNPDQAISYISSGLQYDPSIKEKIISFLKKAVEKTINNSDIFAAIAYSDVMVNINPESAGELGVLFKDFIVKSASALDNQLITSICERVSIWTPSFNTQLASLLYEKAEKEVKKREINIDIIHSYLTTAVSLDVSLMRRSYDLLGATLDQILKDLKRFGKSRFIVFYDLYGSYRFNLNIMPTDRFRLATALRNYEDGDRASALQIFRDLSSLSPNSLEGKLSSEILAPPKPGIINYNYNPFEFRGTWNYGTGSLGTNAGVVIQLLNSTIYYSDIELTFSVTSRNQKQVFIYAPQYIAKNYADPIETLSILDNNNMAFNSVGGFNGGTQSDFNEYIKSISLEPEETVIITARFPMISPGATSIKFVSPNFRGWQDGWFWDNIKVKDGPFD